jgi:hypothetical protein
MDIEYLKMLEKHYAKAYERVQDPYDKDKLDEFIAAARRLLLSIAKPRYYRMKTLILLSSCVWDWQEVEDCRVQAEAFWRM